MSPDSRLYRYTTDGMPAGMMWILGAVLMTVAAWKAWGVWQAVCGLGCAFLMLASLRMVMEFAVEHLAKWLDTLGHDPK